MKDYNGYGQVNYVNFSANKLWQVQIQVEGKDIKVDNVNNKGIIRQYGKEMDDKKEERLLILAKDVLLQRGSYVDDIDSNYKYLVTTDIDKDNPFYNECKITRLVHTLKFIDKKGILCELPIIATNKSLYSDGLTEGKIITTLDSVLQITCQDNECSRKLEVDKRIILDKKAWKVSQVDGLVQGLINITCVSTQVDNVHDDLVNQIADAFVDVITPNPTPIPSPTEPTVTYEISSSSTTLFDVKRYNTNTFTIVKKINGVEDAGASFNISLDYNSNPTTIATLTVIDNKSCKVKNNTGINNETINIKFTDNASGVITTQQVRMVR